MVSFQHSTGELLKKHHRQEKYVQQSNFFSVNGSSSQYRSNNNMLLLMEKGHSTHVCFLYLCYRRSLEKWDEVDFKIHYNWRRSTGNENSHLCTPRAATSCGTSNRGMWEVKNLPRARSCATWWKAKQTPSMGTGIKICYIYVLYFFSDWDISYLFLFYTQYST